MELKYFLKAASKRERAEVATVCNDSVSYLYQIAGQETRIAELERELATAQNGGSNRAAPSVQTGAAQPIATQKAPYAVETGGLAKKVAWCACGRSATQPYCDGSHKGTGLSPVIFDAEAGKTLYLCGCRQSGNKPFCDGSHKSL